MKMSVVVEDNGTKKEFSVEVPGKITGEMIDAIGATIRREFGIPDPPKQLLPQPIIYPNRYVWPYQRERWAPDPQPYWVTCGTTTGNGKIDGTTWATNAVDVPCTFSVGVKTIE